MNDPEVIESLRYLLVPKEERIRLTTLPFDAKKQCFVAEKTEGFIEAVIQSEDEKNSMVTVLTKKDVTQTLKREDVFQMNPPKYEKCEDMADLTYLSEATVLHNLRVRFLDWLIYTYSGLFCVAINPYKALPVYTMKMVQFYRGKKKNEVPPHLYLVADTAYSCMQRDRENQSMLITGESGAGKTVNTKKVIQYFALVAAANAPKRQKKTDEQPKASLEDQIVQTNPVLEAYGNAKTTRNNNSSRFGKFIRIHFTQNFGIAGADIESYLLEKSRITYCMELERNYHIFYQLLSPAFPDIHKYCLVEPDVGKYFFINQGMLQIDGVDDLQEMKDTKVAFDILNFSEEQQVELFKATAAVAIFGNTKWKQRPREEQAEPDGTDEVERVATLLGLDQTELLKGLTKPKIKVGNDYVNKGQNIAQVTNSVGALSKAIYGRLFNWLVEMVNLTLDVKEVKRQYFIGVLDIAGFEAFDYNGFEQLCINFTNERLQQFFNNYMFVLEQEEYKKEGIVWEMMSFGADLQATIDLIEKKLGIFSILEEECIVPKATDMTFKDKLYQNHAGKHPSFAKPKPKKGKAEAHFDLTHYAGVVSYSVDGWLEKNKDPINMTVAEQFKKSKGNKLLAYVFRDIGGDAPVGGGKGKSASQQTISAGHRDQLTKLMNTLGATHPHFVRCIIPNEIKTGGILDAHLVLHQLHCNGVLEGIRICRKGFPSRLLFVEFLQRYGILAATAAKDKDTKKASGLVLEEVKVDKELYRIGLTKVLFKAGVLGQLEEYRDEAVSRIIRLLQAQLRRYLIKKNIKQMLAQRMALSVLQRNLKKYVSLKTWGWWKMMTNIGPLLQNEKKEEERKAREAEEARLRELERLEKERLEQERLAKAKELEDNMKRTVELYSKLVIEHEQLKEVCGNAEQMVSKLKLQKADLESQVVDLEERVSDGDSQTAGLNKKKKQLEAELSDNRRAMEEVQSKLNKSESECKSRENQISKLQDEMAQQDETIARFQKDKKRLEEINARGIESFQQEEDKCRQLSKLKSKLESALDESEENLERERKGRADVDRVKRKLESDLKQANASIEEIEVIRRDLEASLKRKDTDITTLNAKLDEEHDLVSQSQKKVKELLQRIVEAEEETDIERQARIRAEKQRSDLSRELDELNMKLEEAGGVTFAQAELNKKRESELAKLRLDLEEANMQHESSSAQLKKKHQEAVADFGAQIEQLQKSKMKLEKDCMHLKAELNEFKSQAEELGKSKANVERTSKHLEEQLVEMGMKLDDSARSLNEITSQKSRLQSENSSLISQLEEAESKCEGMSRAKQQLNAQMEEARNSADEEARARSSLVIQLKNLRSDHDALKSQLDEELMNRSDLQRKLGNASNEAKEWKQKYETAGLGRTEELEEAKRKLAAKLLEAEEQVEQALTKVSSLEKVKQRLMCDMDDLMVDVEKANSNAASMEKRQKQFDKMIGQWKEKCEAITKELENSQIEARQYSSEVFKLKSEIQDYTDAIETSKRENVKLSEEIKDLVSQLSDGGRSVHELERTKRRLETEKEELTTALEQAESSLEQSESKVVLAQLELTNVRNEIDRRLHEKDEEFENTRRNHIRAVESMQASLDAEIKSKAELYKQKKKLESDINELEISLDYLNRTSAETQKTIKKLNQTITENQIQMEDEVRQRNEYHEAFNASERRVNQLVAEVDEIRLSLAQSERAHKLAESELHEAANHISQLAANNDGLSSTKRKLENDISTMSADLDEAKTEVKNLEESVRKTLADVNRLTEELKQEQDHALSSEKHRKNLDQQIKDLQERLDQAEAHALKSGKKIIQKLEHRIHELESELECEHKNKEEILKEVKRNDRKIKELAFSSEEDKKNQIRMQILIDQLNNKIAAYKRQVEETEEVASLNLAKFRKATNELNEAHERTDAAEMQLAKARSKQRSSASMNRELQQDNQMRAGSVRAGSMRRFN